MVEGKQDHCLNCLKIDRKDKINANRNVNKIKEDRFQNSKCKLHPVICVFCQMYLFLFLPLHVSKAIVIFQSNFTFGLKYNGISFANLRRILLFNESMSY